MPNPFDNPELYECIILGTVPSPGTVKLSGHERAVKWDKQDAKGQTGASMALGGEPLGEFTATFTLAKDDVGGTNDFEGWDAFQALIESTVKGAVPVALPIYHPDLARNGYTLVVNAGIGGMDHQDNGLATVAVKFSEYRPKKKNSGTGSPKPGKTEANAFALNAEYAKQDGLGNIAAKPTATSAGDDELDALIAESKAP